jgi:hypothetical protein
MPRNAAAHALPSKHDPLSAYAHAAVITGTLRPVPLVATKFQVRIAGGLALVTAERTFRNGEQDSIEATLTFPAPIHATVLSLKAIVDGRTVTGKAMRRTAARDTYEDALDRGKTAALHEEVLRGVHMISVGHIAPGATVTVSGTWAMPLSAENNGASLRIPVTVGDIYGRSPLPDSDDLAHASHIHHADIEVVCDNGLAHLLGGGLKDGKARVTLNAPVDIIVTGWSPRTLTGRAADGRRVMLDIAPCEAGSGDVDLAMLVDRSGSMDELATGGDESAGETKHQVIIQALRRLSRTVRPSDRIDLWEFDSHTSVIGDAGGFAAAVERLGEPRGGTEIGIALSTVLAGRATHDIILITDGKSHALDVQTLARSGRRVHAVLIGEDSLEAHVGQLAALTGGQIFIAAGADAGGAIERAFEAARAPRFVTPSIEAGPVSVERQIGGMAVRAAWGDAWGHDRLLSGVSVQARIGTAVPRLNAAASETPVMVYGRVTGEDAHAKLSRAVGAIAASLAIPAMEADAAAALAEAEGLVCHLTSLVLVDEVGEAQVGMPGQRKVATMTPLTQHLGSALGVCDAPAPLHSRRAPIFLELQSTYLCQEELRTVEPEIAPDLLALAGRINWSLSPDALRGGDLSGLPTTVLVALLKAAKTDEINLLAATLGISAIVAALAILARHDGNTNRTAARLARTVLGKAEPALILAAEAAVGL